MSCLGDIADKDYVRHTIDQINQSLPPIKAIIHAAGINEDAVITRQTHDSFTRVMASKIDGSWNLHIIVWDWEYVWEWYWRSVDIYELISKRS